jgi:hypothetical protein
VRWAHAVAAIVEDAAGQNGWRTFEPHLPHDGGELTVVYYDSDKSPCACFADGIAIATYVSVGQRTLTIAPEKAPDGALAVAIIRPRNGGPGFKYTVPIADLAKLGAMNAKLDPRGRWDAVMKEDGLFEVEAAP